LDIPLTFAALDRRCAAPGYPGCAAASSLASSFTFFAAASSLAFFAAPASAAFNALAASAAATITSQPRFHLLWHNLAVLTCFIFSLIMAAWVALLQLQY